MSAASYEEQLEDDIVAQLETIGSLRSVFPAANVDLARTKTKGLPAAAVLLNDDQDFGDARSTDKIFQLGFQNFTVLVFAENGQEDGYARVGGWAEIQAVRDTLIGFRWSFGGGAPWPVLYVGKSEPGVSGTMIVIPVKFRVKVPVTQVRP